jgi:hypothetical protein
MKETFYTVVYSTHEEHFFSLWELIASLSKINTEAQRN